MQQPGGKIRYSKGSRRKQSIRSPHMSSFGILNRNGLEIPAGLDMPANDEDHENKLSTFTEVSMPEQQQGYIKCRKHDFF